jgi:hypothetical protein
MVTIYYFVKTSRLKYYCECMIRWCLLSDQFDAHENISSHGRKMSLFIEYDDQVEETLTQIIVLYESTIIVG